ncbi:CmpA/NrtA family ABC transporter substrate-binding protein [Roseovarius atlanticus]|uniref:CmpA/NrtA family ABC transporter substrate-binding protein n=1 Tax=Roseovarius atlanticus TaxID=1641875 RepID=UPI001C950967|nr:CmpA/NrtA family ABC transporter substrate-binding protein [Roseovarius atlanticus]MBY5987051.1 ABC transporter substrate-binding protein [Roseovarius atlanticus]MBY6125691.1 ABC transporter substrate-binding protein [Roseovarius atlanticus]MBY6149848.1 ABC transporter substrate-binding protein [Roseovarius atlanticus]
MRRVTIPVAYMPLVDAAPLIVAHELGFAEDEAIGLDLVPAPSWSSLRDMLGFGRVDAAHMLSAVPVAMSMGLGGMGAALSAVCVLSVNGNVIGVGRPLEARLRATGFAFDFTDARAAASAMKAVHADKLVFGVPFPFSMHVELLRYWAERTELGLDSIEIRTVPPPLMAEALEAGDIDAFCVGEPWGSVAVDRGVGALLLPGQAIWQGAPEKVLATRTDWAETEPDLLGRLIRAVWQASRWLSKPGSHITAAQILSRETYLDLPPELIDRALSGRMILSGHGEQRHCDGFLRFHGAAASFPWRSQAKWIAHRLGLTHETRTGLAAAASVFRSDLYRRHMTQTDADMPGASEKVEGAILHPTAVGSSRGRLNLLPDRFFDGAIFDPDAIE